MKTIGSNSISKYIAIIMFVFAAIFMFHLVYEIFGHLILWYKYKTGSNLFPTTFILGNDVGWSQNQWTTPIQEKMKFRINYPFSTIQCVTGLYPNFSQIIHNLLGFTFMTLFFYLSYRCFKEMAKDSIFNLKAIQWLRRFCALNLAFGIFGLIEFFFNKDNSGVTFITFLFFAFFGIIIFFIVEFFKKGLELQSENDLTI